MCDDKINKILKIILSCKNMQQLGHTSIWLSKLSDRDLQVHKSLDVIMCVYYVTKQRLKEN